MFSLFRKSHYEVKVYFKNQLRHWHLHKKEVTLLSGSVNTVYYFAQKAGKNVCKMPDGYELYISDRTKMPMLRKYYRD